MTRSLARRVVGTWLIVGMVGMVGTVGMVGAQVPDPTQMSGVPLPSPDLATGTMTVRVVRESLANNIPNQVVRLSTPSGVREATTDASGRATFSGLNIGAEVQATTIVDGVTLESRRITMPPAGGIRVMLFAGAAAAPPAAMGPVTRGTVVLGGETRFIIERGDEALNVFYVVELVNNAATFVDPGGPIVFDLPRGVTGVTLLEGSSEQAVANGPHVTVTGPFAPGKTSLQIGYVLPYRSATARIEQKMPALLPQLAVAGETTGGVTMTSPQFTSTRPMNAEARTFLVGNGGTLAAGSTLSITFGNLPHHPRWPRFLALGLAAAVMIGGLVFGFRGSGASKETGRDLERARAEGLAALRELDARRSSGAIDEAGYASARARVLSELEDIYSALGRA